MRRANGHDCLKAPALPASFPPHNAAVAVSYGDSRVREPHRAIQIHRGLHFVLQDCARGEAIGREVEDRSEAIGSLLPGAGVTGESVLKDDRLWCLRDCL